MGFTIGDVLTVIGFFGAIYLSGWAMVVGFSLVFNRRAEAARKQLESSPWKTLILGAALYVIGALGVVVLLNLKNGILTLFGYLLAIAMLSIVALGGSGLAMLMGSKMQQMDRRCSTFNGIAKSAGYMAMGGLMPLFGWALLFVMILACFGAGFQAIFFRKTAPAFTPLYPAPPVAFDAYNAHLAANQQINAPTVQNAGLPPIAGPVQNPYAQNVQMPTTIPTQKSERDQ